MSIKQTFEKLDSAVQALVGTDALLHERLDIAIARLAPLTEREFPPDCRKEFRQLNEKIRIYRADGDREDLRSDLAGAIFALLKSFIGFTAVFSGGGLPSM